MNMPRFTATVSLYKTNRHYRTSRHTSNPSAQRVSPISPAAREQEGEVIHVHSCPPGYSDIGGSCWPNPLTEPPVGGGGEDLPPGGGPEDGGSGGDPYDITPPIKNVHVCTKKDKGWFSPAAKRCVDKNRFVDTDKEWYGAFCGGPGKNDVWCCKRDVQKKSWDCEDIGPKASQ